MEKNVCLNEEKYQKTKKKLSVIALIVLIIGILIGGGLITFGINRTSPEKIESVKEQLSTEKENLLKSKSEIENKIKPIEDEIKQLERVSFTGFDDAYYARKDKIEELEKSIATDKSNINLIDSVLSGSSVKCSFDEGKNNEYTSKYCELDNKLESVSDKMASTPFYMFGAFAIIVSCMISFSIFMTTKRREIVAFGSQQIMPVAQEGIETISPSLGKTAGDIVKGIKDGLKDSNKE